MTGSRVSLVLTDVDGAVVAGRKAPAAPHALRRRLDRGLDAWFSAATDRLIRDADDEVKSQAKAVTAGNDDDGFAKAMERDILGRRAP